MPGGERFDLAGSIVFGAGLVSLMFGSPACPRPPAWRSRPPASWPWPGSSASSSARRPRSSTSASSATTASSPSPAWPPCSAPTAPASAVAFLVSLCLRYIEGPAAAGRRALVLIAQPVVVAVASPFAGRLSDRTEPRIIASAGMALSAAGLVLFSFLGPGTGFGYIVASLVCLGLGFGLFSSPNTNAVAGLRSESATSASPSAALGTGMRLTGQMMSAGTVMVDLRPGHGPGPDRAARLPAVPPERPDHRLPLFRRRSAPPSVFASLARGDPRRRNGGA
ncbi:MAG: hypothetical protein MZV63_65630 [Marinilabiliales bacterium]|nr:hypothetical protein [Marinilabiliales bacterium]